MRTITLLSGIAILTLSAAAAWAQTQTNAGAAPPLPGVVYAPSTDVPGDKIIPPSQAPPPAAASRGDKAGYNSKASKTPAKPEDPPRRSKFPAFGQFCTGSSDASKPCDLPR